MEVVRPNRGSWVRPRHLSRAEVEAGYFTGGDGRRRRIYGDAQQALRTGRMQIVDGEVVRLDREPGETAAKRGGF